jgi:hypothetical protein
MFAGTVSASANTWKFRNEATSNMSGKATAEFARTEYLRSRAAPSNYLDTAVAPVSWPTRTGPQVSAGPLGKERTGLSLPIPR